MKTHKYLVRPFDQLLIREDPVYRNHEKTYFTVETLNKDLSPKKEYANKEAEDIDRFFEEVREDTSIEEKNQYVFRKLNQPKWVLVASEEPLEMDQLWKRAMKKVRNEEFYLIYPEQVSNTDIISGDTLSVKIYINEYRRVLVVLYVSSYPNVLNDIQAVEDIEDGWTTVKLYGKEFDLNIWREIGEDQYRAALYGQKRDGKDTNVNVNDSISLPVEVATHKSIKHNV